MICKNCGSELSESARFCENCGASLLDSETSAETKTALDTGASEVSAESESSGDNDNLENIAASDDALQGYDAASDDALQGYDAASDEALQGEETASDDALQGYDAAALDDALQGEETALDEELEGDYDADLDNPLLGDEEPVLYEPPAKKVKTKKQKALDIILWLLIFLLVIVGGYTIGSKLGDYMHTQRTEKTVDYSKKAEKLKNFPFHDYSSVSIGTINDVSISDDSFILAWFDQYQSALQMAKYYDMQYGEGMGLALTGFDSAKSPAELFTEDSQGEQISFSTQFSQMAEEVLTQLTVLAKLAQKDGFTMPEIEEVRKTINSIIDNQLSAAGDGEAVAAFELLKKYNKTKTANLIYQYEYLKRYAAAYLKAYPDTLKEGYTLERIEEYYKENSTQIDVVSFFVLATPYTEHEDIASVRTELEKLANEEDGFSKAVEYLGYSEDDYEHYSELVNYSYSSLEQALSVELADWMFAEDRQSGDIFFADSPQQGVMYFFKLTKTASRDESLLPTIRILPLLSSESDELTPIEQANAIVEEFKASEKQDSESFGELVAAKSNDEEMKANGGLIENLQMGEYITEIEEWAYSADRKSGDISAIEFQAGAIVLYYVSTSEKPAWYEATANLLASVEGEEAFKSAVDNAETELGYAVLQASLENTVAATLVKSDEEGTTAA